MQRAARTIGLAARSCAYCHLLLFLLLACSLSDLVAPLCVPMLAVHRQRKVLERQARRVQLLVRKSMYVRAVCA